VQKKRPSVDATIASRKVAGTAGWRARPQKQGLTRGRSNAASGSKPRFSDMLDQTPKQRMLLGSMWGHRHALGAIRVSGFSQHHHSGAVMLTPAVLRMG